MLVFIGHGAPSGPLFTALAALLLALLAAACVSDVRVRRIPNRLVLVILVLGLAIASAVGGLAGAGSALVASAIGFAIWIPFYALGRLGAGDVKLFAASAAWLSPLGAVDAAFLAAFAGGVLAAAWMIAESGAVAGWMRIAHAARYREALVTSTGDARRKLPYGVAMAVGVGAVVFGITIFSR